MKHSLPVWKVEFFQTGPGMLLILLRFLRVKYVATPVAAGVGKYFSDFLTRPVLPSFDFTNAKGLKECFVECYTCSVLCCYPGLYLLHGKQFKTFLQVK